MDETKIDLKTNVSNSYIYFRIKKWGIRTSQTFEQWLFDLILNSEIKNFGTLH
jgi:hypothetical protein